MDTIITYDIPVENDKLRTKVAQVLMDFGCMRIQKSVFLGNLNRNTRDKLKIKLSKVMYKKEGNIRMFPVCEKCIGLQENIGEQVEIEREDIEVL